MKQENEGVECVDYLEMAGGITDPCEGLKLALETMEVTHCALEYEVAIDEARRFSEILIGNHSSAISNLVDLNIKSDRKYDFKSDPFIQSCLKTQADMYSMREMMRLRYIEFEALSKYHSVEIQ